MLTATEAAQLDRFALAARTAAVSAAGRRPVNARGYSLEFHDYRHYQPGDDPRTIDWAIDARLRQLVVRLYRAEGHVPLHLLVDTSGSMGTGDPAKLQTAARAAAALAYVAARRRDPLALAAFDTTLRLAVAPGAGRPHLLRVLDALERFAPRGASSFDRPLTDYGTAVRGPGLAIVLSDLLGGDATPPGLVQGFDGLRFLLHRGFSVALVHVLTRDEVAPVIAESVELVDPEATLPAMIVDPVDAAAYAARVRAFIAEVRSFCAAHSVAYVPLHGESGMDAILGGCLSAGVLALHG
ncbi:MAG TPA: DUF58 domain-containing protein [Vicinamibacterales bacterium]|nr:DUF58 domain-containing protein [Vicinamibacterales bacterium]